VSGGLVALLVLLAGALALGAYLRARTRPAVEAGPKAPQRPQADPALSPLVETEAVPPGLDRDDVADPVARELEERARRSGDGP
jgi:hypothetical protein